MNKKAYYSSDIMRIIEKNGYKPNDFFDINSHELILCKIDDLCMLINSEFLLEGIEDNFEPNDYGVQLENLLDVVNSKRLRNE